MVNEAAPTRAQGSPRALERRSDAPAPAPRLLRAFVFSIPFSIFLAELLLVLTVLAAALEWRGRPRPTLRTPLDLPIAGFAASGVLAAFFGLDTAASLWGLRTYLQIAVVYLVYAYATSRERVLDLALCYLAGSALTAVYTVFTALAPSVFPRLFLGQMTQSEQLLFSIGLALPLLIRGVAPARWLPAALPFYVLALIVNLKRGVWIGALTTVLTVALLTSRKLVLVGAVVIAITLAAAPTVRARIAHSARDLSMPGNRYDIWASAIDVICRFPMGVGRKNGAILRDYPNIPQHHKHAHNNLLQITLEGGFLGLATFVWWMGRFFALSCRAYRRIPPAEAVWSALATAVLASFVGFHVAGLAEYNFGDSEVLEAFFLTMGLGLVIDRQFGERMRTDGQAKASGSSTTIV